MEGNKLEISGRVVEDPPPASYKQIPETELEEKTKERPKSLSKSLKSNSEMDGADEQMLPKEEKSVAADSKIDVGDVKFINNEKQNGEAKLDIGEIKSAFVGMNKEELMKFATDPFWVQLRWILFVAFWLLWLAMLVGAIAIIIAAPKCAPPTPRTWFEQGPLTEVEHDISSEKLQEIKERKFKGVIVSQLDDSYKNANESMELITFLQRAKKMDLNVIVELEPGASRMWFEKSESKEEPFSDFYIWTTSKKNNESGYPDAPNNWLSPNGGSSWKYSEKRKQFYYAPFTMPHLNLRNPTVLEEFSDIMRQWLDAGAKGIRLKNAPFLLVDKDFRDEVITSKPGPNSPVLTDYSFYNHQGKTVNVEGLNDIFAKWKQIVREHNNTEGPLLISDELTPLDTYVANNTLSIDLPKHSKLVLNNEKMKDAVHIYSSLKSALSSIKNHWPIITYSNDITTLSADVMNMFIMLLPGCPLIPYDSNSNNTLELVKIREVSSVMFGATDMELLAENTTFAYSRTAAGNPGYIVALNPSDTEKIVDFTLMRNVSDEVTVQALSPNYDIPKMEPSLKVSAKEIIMPPKTSIILTYVPKSKK